MELKQYWSALWKWKWLILLGTFLAGGAAFLVSRSMTPVYQATTTLLVTPGSPQSSESYASLVASERLAQTYAQLLKSEPLLAQTFERLGLSPPGEEGAEDGGGGFSLPGPLARIGAWLGSSQPEERVAGEDRPQFAFSAEPVRDTQLILLRVEGTDRDWVTEAANTLVEVFVGWQKGVQQARYAESKANLAAGMRRAQADIEETEAAIRTLEAQGQAADRNELSRLQDQLAQYRNNYSALLNSYSNIDLAEANAGASVTVVSPATRPRAPVRPRVMVNTLLAAIVGGMLALGIAFLVEYLDDTVKTQEDLQAAGLSLVAAVQQVRGRRRDVANGLFVLEQPQSLVAESYRTLRTNLQFSALDRSLRSLVVTSALAAEGKTTTAANLATVMAQDGKRVALVDADLRRPTVHRVFGLSNRTGLTAALVDDPTRLEGYLHDTRIQNLRVLTAGPIPPNPQEMLGSERMAGLIGALQEGGADMVILDTPPSLAVADANLLGARADGVLLVVHAGQTRHGAIRQAAEGLQTVGAHLVGAVLNMVPSRKGNGYYYQNYYSQYEEDPPREGGGGLRHRLRRRRKTPPTQDKQAEPVQSPS